MTNTRKIGNTRKNLVIGVTTKPEAEKKDKSSWDIKLAKREGSTQQGDHEATNRGDHDDRVKAE